MISLPFLQTPITSAPVLPVLLNEKKKNRYNLLNFLQQCTKNERLRSLQFVFLRERPLQAWNYKFFPKRSRELQYFHSVTGTPLVIPWRNPRL